MTTIFKDISELITMQGASQKNGRNVKEADLSIIKKAALVVEQGKIVWIGPQNKIPKIKKSKIISLKNQIVMPGFVDSHTHLVFAGDRSNEFEMRNQGKSYQDIAQAGGGIASTVKATREISEKVLLALSQNRINEHIAQGVTTVEIKSGYGLTLKDEIKILNVAKKLKGPRVVATYLGAHAIPVGVSREGYLESILKDLKTIFDKKLSCRADIFIEDIAFNQVESERYLKCAQEIGFDLVAHVNQLSQSEGLTLALLKRARSVDHLNFVSHSQIQALAKSESTAVLVPGADFYLNNPYAPAQKMIEAGVRVAIATNFNPGSCPTQDFQFVGAVARLECKMTYFEVLNGVTVAGAWALGLENEVGSLEIGKHADLIVTDISPTAHFYQVGGRLFREIWRSGTRIS